MLCGLTSLQTDENFGKLFCWGIALYILRSLGPAVARVPAWEALRAGLGALVGGSLQTKAEYGYSGAADETLESSFLKGDSSFIVLGHHGSGFETLLGMRMNRFKAELASTGTSAETLDATKIMELKDRDISIETTQVQLGIGLTF